MVMNGHGAHVRAGSVANTPYESMKRPSEDIRVAVSELLGTKNFQLRCLKRAATSRVFRALTDRGAYFIKSGSGVVEEHSNLRQAHRPGHEQFRLPEIVAFDAKREILVFKYEKGGSLLFDLLRSATVFTYALRRQHLRDAMFLVASWLSAFHEANRTGTRDVASEEKGLATERLREMKGSLTHRERQRLSDVVQSLVIKEAPVCRSNHDFAPRNILIDNLNVTVVDWDKVLEKAVYYNLAYFATNVESRSRMALYSLNHCRAMTEAFIAGYFQESPSPLDTRQLAMFRFLYFLEYLHGYEHHVGVFETWQQSTTAMDRFMNGYVKQSLLSF